MKLPEHFLYTDTHMWTYQGEDGFWWVGITDYAQEMLGDVVFVDAPKVGQALEQNQPCGLIESVKTGSDLHAPLTGNVVAVNADTAGNPEWVNDKPYQTWLFKMQTEATGASALLNATQYQALIG
jgi:glycine cleavage system H protein